MKIYRITKYNPMKRNNLGYYTDNSEWTSISDIDKPAPNSPTFEEYEKVESAYVNAIKSVMADNNMTMLTIDSLELKCDKTDFVNYEKNGLLQNISTDFDSELKNLENGLNISIAQIDKMARLILREILWMVLIGDRFEVRFGYDYYMYITCETLTVSSVQKIESCGLFVEPDTPQRDITFSNERTS